MSLMYVIKERLTQLFKDKESEVMARDNACAWLTKNVSAMDYVLRAGSFRYVCMDLGL